WSAPWPRRGRTRRVRSSSRAAGGASACSWRPPLRIRNLASGCSRCCKACRNWAGSKVAPAHRHPLGRGQYRRHAQIRRRIDRARPRHHSSRWQSCTGPVLQATRTIPIVFTHVPDPVGAGFVESMAHPGGNATGFTSFDYGLSVKWLELLKEIAPRVTRVGVIRDPNLTAGIGQWGAIQGAAPAVGVEAVPLNVRDVAEIERAVGAVARLGNGGLIVTASGGAVVHRELIIALAARHQLPAGFWQRFFVADCGLISYGDDVIEHYRLAAVYIDRILKGEKPGDLPVQLSTKLELVINLNTAKTLGLDVPSTLLARADEVIE